MIVLFSVLIVVLGFLGVVLLKKNNTPGAIGCAVLMVVLVVWNILQSSGSRPDQIAADFVLKGKQVLAAGLAHHIAERHPGKKIVILEPPAIPGVPEGEIQTSVAVDLLVNAFKKKGVPAELIPLPIDQKVLEQANVPEYEGQVFPPEEAYGSLIMDIQAGLGVGQLNAILRKLKGKADVVVYTMSVLPGFKADTLLAEGQGPHLVLVHAGVENFESALQSTVLDAVLTYRPDVSWNMEQKWPKDDVEAFAARYVLATRDNPSPSP